MDTVVYSGMDGLVSIESVGYSDTVDLLVSIDPVDYPGSETLLGSIDPVGLF